jgi:diguanylate cyclase (GGDEF)-like protein/PAS domain S-box-containing protein
MSRRGIGRHAARFSALWLCLAYLFVAVLWHLYADRLAGSVNAFGDDASHWGAAKQWLPPIVTAIFIFAVAARPTTAPAQAVALFRQGNYRLKLLVLAVSALCTVGIIANLVFDRIEARDVIYAQKARNAEILAEVLKEQTTDSVNAVDLALQTTNKAVGLLHDDVPENRVRIDELLENNIRNLPFIRAMWVLDADGNMTHDSQKLPGKYNLADREYFQVHRNHPSYGLYIDRPILSKLGVPFIAYSRRVNAPDGSFAGVVVAALEPQYLRRFYDSIKLGKDGAIALMRSDGVLMLRVPPSEGKEGKKLEPLPEFVKKLASSESGSYRSKSRVDGVDRVYFYTRVPGRPLVVLVGLGEAEILAEWRSTSQTYAMVSAAFLLAIAGLSYLVLHELNRRNALNQALKESDDALKAAQRMTSLGNWRLDFETMTGSWSDEMYRLLGIDPAPEPPSLNEFLLFLHPDDRAVVESTVRNRAAWSGELRSNPDNGAVRYFHAKWSAVHDDSGRVTALVGTLQDVTERRQMDEKLRLGAHVFEHTRDGIIVTDIDNTIVAVNAAFERITGYSEAEVLGRNPRLLYSDLHDEAFIGGIWRSLRTDRHWRGEFWGRRKNGEVFPEWLAISAVTDAENHVNGYVAVFTDLTEIKEANEQVKFLINHDLLTGLPNRTLLSDRLEQAIDIARVERRQIALLLLNIDRLQRVNDSIGHEAGDAVLRDMAHRLLATLRPSDTLARLGSDEFVLVITQFDDADDINARAQQMLDSVGAPCRLAGHDLTITASIGIAVYPVDGGTPSDLIKNADTALSHVKHEGRNGFRFFAAEMNRHAVRWMSLEHQLRGALERDEFILHYQPKICIADERICGVEALIRWNSASLGQVSPADFIPLAEDTNLIIKIGEWVIRTACRQNKAWQDAGLPPLPVAVNVSAVQITAGTLPAIVRSALQETGLPPHCLEIELTESVLMREAETAMKQIAELRAMGIAISLDDFGTGYSSLSYLSRFALDKLKIDQSFVRNLISDSKSAAIAQATIALAHGLGMIVIAEGVETPEQLDYLRTAGCDEIQGFLISRPVTPDRLAELLR